MVGVYQMGDVQARSWIVAGNPAGMGTPRRAASRVLQRGVGRAMRREHLGFPGDAELREHVAAWGEGLEVALRAHQDGHFRGCHALKYVVRRGPCRAALHSPYLLI
jgi:hypothetical protein